MKKQNKQILAMLYAFDEKEVLMAFDLYKSGIKDQFQVAKDELKKDGWSPQKEKPEDKEFYFFDGEYWVQSEEMRQKHIDEVLQKAKEKKVKYTGQKMDLKYTDLKCPKCGSGMYKQSICPGCKEGKTGARIKLICENNPDHEFNL